jgi:superoxide reductase
MAQVKLAQRLQEADWKKEKHVPVIDSTDQVKAGELFDVRVSLRNRLI